MAALKYPARLESNNPAAYGIVKAAEISGHKTTNIAFLTSIPDAILSESGNNTNDDAIGQIWCTTDSEYGTLKYYKLTNWNKRNDYTGWKEIYALDDDFNSDIKGGLCRSVDLYDEKSNNKININLSAQYIKNGGVGFQTKTATIPLASSTEIGLMSSADKTKLDSIQGNGGEDNVIESIKVNGIALPITDKSVDIPIETVDLSNYIQNSASDKDNQIRIASQDVILDSNFSTILVDSYGTTISSNENTNIICSEYRLALFDYYTGIILNNSDKTEKIEIGGGEAGNGNKFTRFTSNNLDFTNVKAFTGIKTINGQSILGTGNISTSYTLPIASDTVLGCVKVGAGLSINNGVLSANGGGTADAVDWSNVQNKPTFSTVATSGSYNDLTDKPSIYTLPVANNELLGGVILGRETYSSLGEFTITADSNNRIYTTIPYAKDGVLPNNLGLITKKDYTNFLENYDWYKSITGDDTDTIINKYQEIVNFLDTYTEADTLANILSNKADKTDVNSIAADVAALDADKADKTELATKADVEIVDALAANVNTLNTSKANQESVDLLDQKIDEVNNNKLDKPIDIYVWWNDYSRTYDIECKEYCLSKNKQNIKNLQLKTQNRFYFNTQCDVNVHYVYKEGTEFLTGDIHQACGIYNIDEDRILFNFYEIHTTGFTAENITAGFRYIKNTDTLEITQINPLGVDSKNNILYFDRFISYFSNNTTLEYNKSYTFDTSKEIPTSFDIESDKYISIDEMLNAVGHPDKIICSFENRDVTSRMQLLRTDNESTNNSSVYSTNYYSTPFNNNNTRLHIKISTGGIQNITVTFDNIHADTITSSEASTIANGAVIANENAKTTAKETILATVNNMVPTLFDLAGNNNRLKVKAIDVIADIPTVTGDGLWKILFCTFVDDQNVNKVYLVDKRDNDNIIHPEFYSYMHSSTIFDNTEGSASQGLSFFTLLIEENCDHQIFDYQTPA